MAIDVFINDGVPNKERIGGAHVSHIETCLFWRSARRVLNDGNPAQDNVVVCVPGRSGEQYPLFIVSLTKARRLICWPVLPEEVCVPDEEPKLHLIDHVTLELQSRRSHTAAYGSQGGKLPTARKWKLFAFPNNGVSLWFGFTVKYSVVERQVLERHQWIRFTTPDVQRRKDEYVRFFERLRFKDANVPMDWEPRSDDAICGFVYVVDRQSVALSTELLPQFNQTSSDFWDAPDEPPLFNVNSTGIAIGHAQLGLLLGVLPGILRDDGPFLLLPHE